MPEKSKEQIMEEMDKAAKEAQVELLNNYKGWSCQDVSTWWVKWYLKAGHKRLGRSMVALDKMVKKLPGATEEKPKFETGGKAG